MNRLPKILYLQGRPRAHKMHARFAESIGADFMYVDFKLRWQDTNKSFLFRLTSWVVCAFSYPRDYDIYLVDNLHMAPVLMKFFGILRKDQKIIAHMGSHTLYFMHSGWFSAKVNLLHRFMLKRYDVLLCEGLMAEELANKILRGHTPTSYYTFLGPPAERMTSLRNIKANFLSKNITHISSGPDGFRTFYKGIFEMIQALDLVVKVDPSVSLTIVGNWDDKVIKEAYSFLAPDKHYALIFVGVTDQIETYLQNSGLYLHCSNGDAFPTSTIEAMTAGIVPIVSYYTGTKQIVSSINPNLVVEQTPEAIASGILWYFNLDESVKFDLSEQSRTAVSNFTEALAIAHYQNVFQKITKTV